MPSLISAIRCTDTFGASAIYATSKAEGALRRLRDHDQPASLAEH